MQTATDQSTCSRLQPKHGFVGTNFCGGALLAFCRTSLLVDGSLRLLWASSVALAQLTRFGREAQDSSLLLQAPIVRHLVRAVLASPGRELCSAAVPRTWPEAPLLLRAIKVGASPWDSHYSISLPADAVLIEIRDPATPALPSVGDLAHLFGLTDSEEDVVLGAVAGEGIARIAVRRKSAEATVRTQLKAAMRKMRVNTQADLIRLVLAYAAQDR